MAVHKAETVLFKEERANTKRKADVFKEMRAKGVESGVVFPPDRGPMAGYARHHRCRIKPVKGRACRWG
ncbi:hypothetical protein ACL2XQ_03680 [Sodalis sp. RH14]|uniref:hypothetical protein n=1 Tax=Sodalis sp. RH14 TaxID=3394329 RepID=UPI0039B56172